ncbi:MAG: ABC transporter ATP-binding protein/permease [Parachlamydia sp.]|nr:ABC transporter ATP-binding protein/permease [Parachlamydia sp.]
MNSIPKTLGPYLWHFVRKEWKLFLAAQILSFAWSIDHTLWPYVLMLLVDAITNFTGDKADLWPHLTTPITLGVSLLIGIDLAYRGSGILLAKAIPRTEASIRMSMFDYVQRHSYSYFANNFAGNIANKIMEMPQNASLILQLVITLFLPVILALGISVYLFSNLQPWFAVILVGWIIVHMGVTFLFAGKCSDLSDIHATSRSNLSGKIVDSLTNSINVRLFARHRFETQYLSKYQNDERQKHWNSLWYIEKMKIAMGILSILGPGLLLNWYMIYSWQHDLISTGALVFIFNTSWNITIMVWLAGLELPSLYKQIGVCKQALTIIQEPHGVVDIPGAVPLKVSRGEIAFEHVSFNYMKGKSLFKDKSLLIQAGEKIGLVGFSGSGKTTFVHLMLRYFDIEKGRILIDGQDISKVTQDSLRSQIALIPQDASLFHRSLIDNIRYGRLEATDEEIYAAAKQANADEFIEKMPEKYATPVGERGIRLSGGQRQRIAIARAILKNAPILILDEATSSLDSVTESLIQQSLQNLMQNRTSIVIAHRLSTLSGMDRILVFKEGKIVEEGNHEHLLAEDGHYATMWRMQAGGFLPDGDEEEDTEADYDY